MALCEASSASTSARNVRGLVAPRPHHMAAKGPSTYEEILLNIIIRLHADVSAGVGIDRPAYEGHQGQALKARVIIEARSAPIDLKILAREGRKQCAAKLIFALCALSNRSAAAVVMRR